jgi:catechol 2,3-dioxygenase-like lactoylglutathione lyase family enzyme
MDLVRRSCFARRERRNIDMQNVLGLDHVIVLVRDLDDAERRLARLGFRPTPRGVHSPAMGTANATVMFGDDTYFETLAILKPTPANEATRAALARREGPYGIALKTDDARAAAAEFEAAGIAAGDALDFARPVDLPGGPREALFTVARTRAGSTPGAWLFVCQHHTPEMVWRQDYLEHPNGALGLAEVVGVAEDLDRVATAYRAMFGDRVQRTADRVDIQAGASTISFLSPGALRARFGDLAESGGQPRLVALRVKVHDMDALRAVLAAGGLHARELPSGTVAVPAEEGCGTLFEFGV